MRSSNQAKVGPPGPAEEQANHEARDSGDVRGGRGRGAADCGSGGGRRPRPVAGACGARRRSTRDRENREHRRALDANERQQHVEHERLRNGHGAPRQVHEARSVCQLQWPGVDATQRIQRHSAHRRDRCAPRNDLTRRRDARDGHQPKRRPDARWSGHAGTARDAAQGQHAEPSPRVRALGAGLLRHDHFGVSGRVHLRGAGRGRRRQGRRPRGARR